MLTESEETSYADPEVVNEEVIFARRLFTKRNINVIDVSRRSIEETAATIMQHHHQFTELKS
jgi:regulator of PEP synthase PpsR (kinase-PPPase family)